MKFPSSALKALRIIREKSVAEVFEDLHAWTADALLHMCSAQWAMHDHRLAGVFELWA